MTDMAVAAEHAIFGLPEVKVGVFPMQVLSLLQNIAPPRLVAEWSLTGEPFDAKAALEAGLLNYVVPTAELDAKVEWLVGRIVDKSPTAIRRGKYAMRAMASMSFDESIAYTESQIAVLAMTEDAKEGRAAFAEKRKPSWTGKCCLRRPGEGCRVGKGAIAPCPPPFDSDIGTVGTLRFAHPTIRFSFQTAKRVHVLIPAARDARVIASAALGR
jgi:hypothetical protein